MPTEQNVVLEGKAKWAQYVYRPDSYGKWRVNLYLTPESLERFKAMKVMNHLKKDDDGYYVILSRPGKQKLKNGSEVPRTPPIVVDKNNNPTEAVIGDGSDIKVELEYYSWNDPFSKQKKSACRLYRVKILNAAPYEAPPKRESEELEF